MLTLVRHVPERDDGCTDASVDAAQRFVIGERLRVFDANTSPETDSDLHASAAFLRAKLADPALTRGDVRALLRLSAALLAALMGTDAQGLGEE